MKPKLIQVVAEWKGLVHSYNVTLSYMQRIVILISVLARGLCVGNVYSN